MIDTLYERAHDAFWTIPKPDWKKDMSRAYRRMIAADTDAERLLWKDKLAESFLPFCFFLAFKRKRDDLGFSQRDAFHAGIAAFPRALAKFDPKRSSIGYDGISAHIGQYAEWDMMRALDTRIKREQACPLEIDAYENGAEFIDELTYVDSHEIYEHSISDIIRSVIDSMPPVDAWMATHKLLDGMTWDEISAAGNAMHDEHYRRKPATWSYRWTSVVRRQFEEALRAYGYEVI